MCTRPKRPWHYTDIVLFTDRHHVTCENGKQQRHPVSLLLRMCYTARGAHFHIRRSADAPGARLLQAGLT